MTKVIPAKEYCNSVFDGTHATPKPVDVGMPLVTSKNIVGRRLDLSTTYNISEQDYFDVQKRSAVSQWDILFSMIGSVGEVYLESSVDIPYAIKNIGVFSTKDEDRAKWLYYYLQSPPARTHIKRYLNGAVQKFLHLGALRDFPVLPYEDSDKGKVDILSALDAKIELNNRINAELEAMAKTLYETWFVQFDFPDTNNRPYKSTGGKMVYNEKLKRDIPTGWEAVSLKEILPVLTGKEDANFATKNGQYMFFTCGDETLRCDEYKFEGRAVLLSGNGNFNAKIFEGRFNAYQRTYVLIPTDPEHFAVAYFAVKDSVAALTQGSRGSIIKFLTKGDVESISIALPRDRIEQQEYLAALNNALLEILSNQKQNQHLTSLRDFLLPMLMNGQVEVGEE